VLLAKEFELPYVYTWFDYHWYYRHCNMQLIKNGIDRPVHTQRKSIQSDSLAKPTAVERLEEIATRYKHDRNTKKGFWFGYKQER
jgi:hypothetical protein